MSLNISELWDFSKPEESEGRLRAALSAASPEEKLTLQTQIARSYGLRGDFVRAREMLAGIEAQVQSASAEPQVRYFLELGRTYASATHPPETQTPETREKARSAYTRAFELAEKAGLDGLAIDALHMMALVDTDPKDQLAWDMQALAYMEKSTQPGARQWEGSLRNNVGYALHQLGRYEEALTQFELALAAYERVGKPESIRIAHWMIAWTLRALRRVQGAIAIQSRLEHECDAAGEPDPYVFDELIELYRALGDQAKVEHYLERRQNLK